PLPSVAVDRLAREASKTAAQFFNVCVRAIDYCQPVDITFGDYLRALVTADLDLVQEDRIGYRDLIIEAFRLRGIPTSATHYSEEALLWTRPEDGIAPLTGLRFGVDNRMTVEDKDQNGRLLRRWASAHARELHLRTGKGAPPVHVPAFHPLLRIGPRGE